MSSWSPLTNLVRVLWHRGRTELIPAVFAPIDAGAFLCGQNNFLIFSFGGYALESKTEGVDVDSGEDTDADADADQLRSVPARSLGVAGFENRVGDADFVHQACLIGDGHCACG
jgi:hypothetical protein